MAITKPLHRRDFLKLGVAALGALAFRPYFSSTDDYNTGLLARIGTTSVSVYEKPNDKSKIICQKYRDELVNIYYEVTADAPGYNPLWYRVWRGFIHSGHLQRVKINLNPVVDAISSPEGAVAEITVPFTQSYRYLGKNNWQPLYRLYYESIHWVMGVDEGPDGTPWYRLKDELLEIDYHVPAIHVRIIPPEELTPIAPDVPWEKKRIEVSIANQTVTAYEGETVVLHTKCATGIPAYGYTTNGIPTDTPRGIWHVHSKMPSKHMGDGNMTSDIEAYELPGVPWVTFFHQEYGVAFHGTYWHTNFGIQMSHGCVNMRTAEAKWIYRWTYPIVETPVVEKNGYGTRVIVT